MGQDLLSSFRAACGLDGLLELELQGPRGVARHAFERPYLLVGRDPRADLVLDDDAIRPVHAYVQAISGRLFAVALEEPAVAGARPDADWVDPGRGLDLGPYQLRPAGPPAPAPAPAWPAGIVAPLSSRPRAHDQLPGLEIEALRRDDGAGPWPMFNLLVLAGRSPACRIRMDDRALAPFHAALLRTPAGAWAVDLLGPGGIAINDREVREAPLAHGDVLRIGRRRFRLRSTPPAGREAPGRALARRPAPRPAPLQPIATPPSPPALVDPSVVLLMEQFQSMQQQMFDQFQQALGSLAQWFGAMHRDQMDQLRAELDEVRRLNRELADLRAAATAAPQPEPQPQPGLSPAPAAPPPPAAAPAPPPPLHPTGGVVPPDPDIHLDLARRIVALQQEQQGRWQKIFGLVAGRS